MVAPLGNALFTITTGLAATTKLRQVLLRPVDMAPGEWPPWTNEQAPGTGQELAFQFWPESLSDTKSSEWTARMIPGGSHPLYQWASGGERALSFTAIFATDTEPDAQDLRSVDQYESMRAQQSRFDLGGGPNFRQRDMDLRSAVAWLRWFMYPSYGASGADIRAYEPAKCLLTFPNTGLGYAAEGEGTGVSDSVLCAMRQCDVTYQAWFPSGHPRLIEVSLSFVELVQSGERVAFQGRKQSWNHARVAGSYRLPRET